MKSILIIDDEQSFLLALELVLKSEGYNVLTASTGEEGLNKAKDSQPDLILLDVMMPGIGGLETLSYLKAKAGLKKIPVILMSGARPPVKQSDYRWNAFLLKPFNLTDLIAAIHSSLK